MRAASTTSSIPWAHGTEIFPRVMLVGAYFVIWYTGYYFTNALGSEPSRAIHLVRPCDLWPAIIQPWTAIIYVFGGFVLPLLPCYYNWAWPKLRFVLFCYTICSVLAFSCYLVWPLSIVRPSFEGPGLGRWLMRQVLTVDNEANCFPSSHVYYAVLGAILVRHGGAGRPARWATYVLAVAVCATTVTTGQHYFLDIAGGLVVAVLSYLVTRSLLPEQVGGKAGGEPLSVPLDKGVSS
jgi:membrane-associated phospholipid phosphatase